MTSPPQDGGRPIVALDKFIQATRDSGYKGTPSAVSELVDNALQAGATCIDIKVENTDRAAAHPIRVAVQDNGCGMSPSTLLQALRFGGTTRFNDRSGLGRYGMGLPNASLGRARRVTVYAWQSQGDVYSTYLDVDEIAAGRMVRVPRPRRTEPPDAASRCPSGTTVVWSGCDRLENRRATTIALKLAAALGRRFRHFLWNGVDIAINGDPVEPIDPLYLHPAARYSGAAPYGAPMKYEVRASATNGSSAVGTVWVTFSELPVHDWYRLSNKEKRRLGVSKGAGVSVVRADREVDYGWFFLSGKRRENYDDWWRCEIRFDPVLDEAFGITHTKQQVRPCRHLVEALAPDIAATARVLNARARRAHLRAKAAERVSESEQLAAERDRLLAPIDTPPTPAESQLLDDLKQRFPDLRTPAAIEAGRLDFKVRPASLRSTEFFACGREMGRLVLALNVDHPFYKAFYRHLDESDAPADRHLRAHLELLLLAALRSEASEEDEARRDTVAQHRRRWSDVLATFLNG